MYDIMKEWISGLELTLEQQVLGNLILSLAEDYDQSRSTATASELRKSAEYLRKMLSDSKVEVDPLEALLKR